MDGNINKDAVFKTTCWTLVLQTRGRSAPEAVAAMEQLCRLYWYPLYAYSRSKGHAVEDAQDLTQEFFARVLEKNYLDVVDRKKGKFRWFLLTAFKYFLANDYDRERAEKRGGGHKPISLEVVNAENQLHLGLHEEGTSDLEFDRRWAMTVLRTAQDRLRAAYGEGGKVARFEMLENYLPGQGSTRSYAETSAALGISEAAVKMEVHRMRQRFGELLKEEIARTVADESEIEEEIRYLIEVVAR